MAGAPPNKHLRPRRGGTGTRYLKHGAVPPATSHLLATCNLTKQVKHVPPKTLPLSPPSSPPPSRKIWRELHHVPFFVILFLSLSFSASIETQKNLG